jgi:thiol-disulfide isomerase/thioredoxin
MSWLFLLLLAQSEYRGTLAPELDIPDRTHLARSFTLATPEERKPLGDVDGVVFIGKIRNARAFVVEGSSTALYVDLGGLRKFDLQSDGDPLLAGIADVPFPLPGPAFKTYPVRVYVYRPQKKPDSRMVGESPRAFAHGTAAIDRQEIPFEFEFDLEKNAALADNGHQSIDGESAFLKDERPVYHAAGRYFSVRSLDLDRHEFVLDSRPASDYIHISLKTGEIFPDFPFTDFEGRRHRLSDYQGRVLLDFWATWCAPCMAEIPTLRQLHDRGLQIIGMNADDDPEKPRALHLPWPQAALPGIREIIERRARIQTYPTYVLLDADRRIIALNEDALK